MTTIETQIEEKNKILKGLEKVYEKLMPDNKTYKPDFTLNLGGEEVYVEYFGLSNYKDDELNRYNKIRKIKEILKKITSNIRLNKNRMLGQNFDYFKTLNIGEEATASLKLLIYQKIKYKSKLKFRFLTPDSIINFTGQVNNKFAPYVGKTISVSGSLYKIELIVYIEKTIYKCKIVPKTY